MPTSMAGRPEGLSVFAVSTAIFLACRRMGGSAFRRTRSRTAARIRFSQEGDCVPRPAAASLWRGPVLRRITR